MAPLLHMGGHKERKKKKHRVEDGGRSGVYLNQKQ